MELNQLWSQFRLDTRTSYRLYSRGIDYVPRKDVNKGRHWQEVSRQLFWAILEKLSPARRVLLLLAFVLVNPPAVPDVDIAFSTRPANTVGGDYYDVFSRPAQPSANPSYLVAVADVAGKSIPAELLMATFQASLKTLSSTPSSLVELVVGMNHYACSNSQSGLRRNSGRIERLDAGGLPLGINADALYQAGTVTLEAGDWLVVFTDRVVEAVNEADTEYGEERLISSLNAGVDTSPATMLSRTMADLDLFVGNTPQHDDITCLLIKAV